MNIIPIWSEYLAIMKIMVTEQNMNVIILGNVKINNYNKILEVVEKWGGEKFVLSFIFYSREPNDIVWKANVV